MSTSSNPSDPVNAGGTSRSLSAWSVSSLILFALTILAPLPLLVFLRAPGGNPAAGAALAFLLFVGLTVEVAGTVLGIITGSVGTRRSRGYAELPWAGLALNSALLLLQLVLPLVVFAVSEPGANWVVASMICLVGAVFAALVGVREFVGRGKRMSNSIPADRRFGWMWFLGLVCGSAVMLCILRLAESR